MDLRSRGHHRIGIMDPPQGVFRTLPLGALGGLMMLAKQFRWRVGNDSPKHLLDSNRTRPIEWHFGFGRDTQTPEEECASLGIGRCSSSSSSQWQQRCCGLSSAGVDRRELPTTDRQCPGRQTWSIPRLGPRWIQFVGIRLGGRTTLVSRHGWRHRCQGSI